MGCNIGLGENGVDKLLWSQVPKKLFKKRFENIKRSKSFTCIAFTVNS